MKTLPAAVLSLIAEKGIEPVNILEIQWVENGTYHIYGDKEITNYEFYVDGVILELSNLESTIKLDSEGQSQSINVTLDDTNGSIKEIINNNDIHGRTVKLFQWFETLPLSERFQLYEGEINSPINWDEGDRTISFSIITKLADKEVGFSPEEADFDFLPNDLIGKPWPMAFGTVQNVPATRLQDVPVTQLAEDLGETDPTISKHIAKLDDDLIELEDWLRYLILATLLAAYNRDFGDPADRAYWEGVYNQLVSMQGQVVSQINAATDERSNLYTVKNEQDDESNDTIELIDGASFPQNTPIVLKVGTLELHGTLSGNIFNINSKVIDGFNPLEDYEQPFGFTFIQAGTTVTIQTENKISYIANIIDSEIHSVQVYREVENGKILVTIPTNLYTVRKVTSGVFTFTLIEFDIPLSSQDETLENDIYVTLTSTVGPNTVDIMEWLIDTYTDLTYDTTTFDYVKAKIENYPSHFAMLERKNILTMLEEMAMQSRCAIWLNNGVFYIKYLSEELTEDITITESDIDAGSMVLGATQTEELVTKLIASWTDNYVLEEDHRIILRHNVKKYGTREREINFYIYNINELVLKSATFWLIRLSNIWKILTFDTYVSNLAMETFDTVLLDFNETYVADTDIKALVTDLIYDTNNGLLNTTCWLPVKFGTMEQYDFSWPSQISIDLEFPTEYEVTKEYAGSSGPGENVEGEDFNVKITGVTTTYNIRDRGDRVPSDLDDQKPTPRFPGTPYTQGEEPGWTYEYNDYEFEPSLPPPPTEFIGAIFPGVITSKVGTVNDKSVYKASVYTNGLSGEPETGKSVIQLQIVEAEEIPVGTWCMVAKNQQPLDPATNERLPGLNNDGFEWTIQVPIWL